MSWVISCFNPQEMLDKFYDQQKQEIPFLNSMEQIQEKQRDVEIKRDVLRNTMIRSLDYYEEANKYLPENLRKNPESLVDEFLEDTDRKIEQLIQEQIELINEPQKQRGGRSKYVGDKYSKYLNRYRRYIPR